MSWCGCAQALSGRYHHHHSEWQFTAKLSEEALFHVQFPTEQNHCLDVCMESTGKYWVPVFNILEQRGLRVVIANPKWVQAVKGNKDDEKDSKWIGELFRMGLVKSSFIPDKPIRWRRVESR